MLKIFDKRGLLGRRVSLLSVEEPTLFIHARPGEFQNLSTRGNKFFATLEAVAARHGLDTYLVRASERHIADMRTSHHLNVLYGVRPVFGPHVLHACPTYVPGFWYFDQVGVRENSTIGLRDYRPEMIREAPAEAFAKLLSRRILERERTKYDQPERGAALRTGSIAVFAQEFDSITPPTLYLDLQTVLETVIRHRGDRHVYIKAHPKQTEKNRAWIDGLHAPEDGVSVVDAHIFDMLEACDFTVSQCSAASFEGFLFGKPAIIAARTDFHHNTITARTPEALADAMQAVLAKGFDHKRYLTWFLRDQCISPWRDDFEARLEARIIEKGYFRESRLGET